MSTLVEARHLVELGNLEEVFTAIGYKHIELLEKSAEVPYHTLLLGLDADEKGRLRQLALTFYPVADFEDTLFLQYFSELPFDLKEATLPAVYTLLPEINNRMVLGYFGVSDGGRKLHFRYVQTFADDDLLSQDRIETVTTMVAFSPMLFADVLEAVASGQMSLVEARANINAKYSDAA